jgi:hypothetical protein
MNTLLMFLVAAGTIDPGTPDKKHLDYGDQFKCVARISCLEKDTGRAAWASCVLIGPKHVLTAAHVVEGAEAWVVHLGDEKYPLAEVFVHEDFRKPDAGCCDIAVGRVMGSKEFGLDFYPALYGHADETGKVVSICGHGIAGTFLTGCVLADGKKRAGSNIVDYIDSNGMIVCSVGSGVKTELEFLISPGDSGGGLFIGKELAGVNSATMAVGRPPLSKLGDESGHARVSKHKEWILEHTK